MDINFNVIIEKQYGNSVKLTFWCAEIYAKIWVARNPTSGIWEGPYTSIGHCIANTLEELEDFEELVERTLQIVNVLTMDVQGQTYNNIVMSGGITVVTPSTNLNTMLSFS